MQMSEKMKLASPKFTRRQIVATIAFAGAELALGGEPTAEGAVEPRTPSSAGLEVAAIGKVLSLAVLSKEDQDTSRRRLSVIFETATQIGLPVKTKACVIRFNGLSRAFGLGKDEALTGRTFLIRFLDKFADPYDGRFEVWELKGASP